MSLVDDIQLIEEVKKYPLLFDTNIKGYKDNETKDTTWVKIASDLQVKPHEAKNRWRNLRDRFVREKKLISSENETDKAQKASPWPLLEHMSFMWNFIIHRRRYTMNAVKNEPKTYLPIAPKSDTAEWMISLDCDDNNKALHSKNDHESKSKRQKLLPCQEQSMEETPELYHVSNDTRSYSQKTDQCISSQSYVADEQHYFCMSVAETLRRFTQRQSAEAKLKIQQILYETEFSNANTAFEDAFIDAH
ncbi:transcription factor Adf-1-like [Neodiprion fabricii]|uniref:transcription factor Adf-1-like n=1 Tax=Neodiprion fabricii TaxID=2872261 RepID=UPI001ED91457|nr:transcription factor Adf-1-like [Neodiprion fabricii]